MIFVTKINRTGITITGTNHKGCCRNKEIVIPETIRGKRVTEIGRHAFHSCSIISVKIPNTVTKIHHGAFITNKLTSVVIPDSVTCIEDCVFENNNLINVSLPHQSIINIGCGVFSRNRYVQVKHRNLKFKNNKQIEMDDYISVLERKMRESEVDYIYTVDNGVITIKGVNGYCPKDLVIPSEINGKKVTIIGYESFCRKCLTSIVIPETVTLIDKCAFANNKLTSIVIPETVTRIYDYAFDNNPLKNVVIPDSVEVIGDCVFNDDVEIIYNEKEETKTDMTEQEKDIKYRRDILNKMLPDGIMSLSNITQKCVVVNLYVPCVIECLHGYRTKYYSNNEFVNIIHSTSDVNIDKSYLLSKNVIIIEHTDLKYIAKYYDFFKERTTFDYSNNEKENTVDVFPKDLSGSTTDENFVNDVIDKEEQINKLKPKPFNF